MKINLSMKTLEKIRKLTLVFTAMFTIIAVSELYINGLKYEGIVSSILAILLYNSAMSIQLFILRQRLNKFIDEQLEIEAKNSNVSKLPQPVYESLLDQELNMKYD